MKLFNNHTRILGITLLTALAFWPVLSFLTSAGKPIIAGNTNNYYPASIIGCAPGKLDEPFDNSAEEVTINNNRKPAGKFIGGVYYISLEARTGNWFPETRDGKPIKIKAFAEEGKPLQVPGPLIRVPEGTEIRATIRNRLDEPIVLYGFITRPGNFTESATIRSGETREIKFNAGAAGTFLYTVRDNDEKLIPPAIIAPFLNSQLYGAFIIDTANQKPDPKERVFVIGICGDQKNEDSVKTQFVINGLSWPYTERLRYTKGDTVHWRIINASVLIHPMHLHGFPFTVNSFGTPGQDSMVPKEKERLVVTQMVTTIRNSMKLTWVTEKQGNWLFHCHLLDHVLPESFLRKQPANHATLKGAEHARHGMGGLVMGIEVKPDGKVVNVPVKKRKPQRQLTLLVGGQPQNYFHNVHGKGFQLVEKGMSASKDYSIPGPPIILTRDEPITIKIINRLKEPTTLHWHGLEIESYYDGVAGWGTDGKKLSPLIQPGDSFTVHLAPPRAGTFMYHTHMHDKQLLDGLYGPLIVVKPGEKYDPETDKIFIISQGGNEMNITRDWTNTFSNVQFLLNGSQTPETLNVKKGISYRFRIINIAAQEQGYFTSPQLGFFISLKKDAKPVRWKLIDIDGMEMPARLHNMQLAEGQRNGPGTTKDYEFTPQQAGDYFFEVKQDQTVVVRQLIRVSE